MRPGRLLSWEARDAARERTAVCAAALRVLERRASELARAERVARFPVLTPANIAEALAFQERRIAANLRCLLRGLRRARATR